jgi:hypothetical protein
MTKEFSLPSFDELIANASSPQQTELLRQAKSLSNTETASNNSIATSLVSESEEVADHLLVQQISQLDISQKTKLALLGNKSVRNILIRDSNQQVTLLVLQNPKLSLAEILDYAKNTNLDELVFREISKNSAWMRDYAVKLALVSNPRVPVDISLGWIKYLKDRDLRRVSRSKNVSAVVSSQCLRLCQKRSS